jgi:uncharacterized membrane protein
VARIEIPAEKVIQRAITRSDADIAGWLSLPDVRWPRLVALARALAEGRSQECVGLPAPGMAVPWEITGGGDQMAQQKSRRGRTSKGSDGAAEDEKPKRRRSTKRKAGTTTAVKDPPAATEAVVQEEEQVLPAAERQERELQELERRERTVREELRSIMRESAIEVLGPVTRNATRAAAKYAATKAPVFAMKTVAPRVRDTLAPRIEEAGGARNFAKDALSGVTGAGSGLVSRVGIGTGAAARSTGEGRRLPVQESVDVAVPLETAYDQFTHFEELPKFMHRVEKVERDDTHLIWHENIRGVRREWEAEITEQRPNERIAWKSLSGTQTSAVLTFHRLSDRLTRIEVNFDFQPQGLLEKAASGLRMSRRALRSDLMRFKAFIERQEEESGRSAERGEVVEEPDAEEPEELEDEELEDEELEAEELEDEEPELEAEEPEETDAEPDEYEEEEEPEAREEEEEKPKKKPVRRRQVRRRPPARRKEVRSK